MQLGFYTLQRRKHRNNPEKQMRRTEHQPLLDGTLSALYFQNLSRIQEQPKLTRFRVNIRR